MNEADYRYLIAHHELGHACAVLHMRRLHGDPSYKFDWIGIGNVRGFEGGMVSGPFADPIAAALISMAGPMADARLLGRPLHRPPPPTANGPAYGRSPKRRGRSSICTRG